MKKTHDYIHHYLGYWSDGGKCRIRIYREDGRAPVVVCSQLPDNDNTSVTNMAEYLAAGFTRVNYSPPIRISRRFLCWTYLHEPSRTRLHWSSRKFV